MSSWKPDPPQPSDSDALLALIEDRLKGATALIAIAETTAREIRTMVQGPNGALQEMRNLLRTGTTMPPPGPASRADPATEDREDGERRCGASGGERVAGRRRCRVRISQRRLAVRADRRRGSSIP